MDRAPVLRGLLVLCACQLVGELVVRTLGLPVPGPVAGMLVLLVLLSARRSERPSSAEVVADRLLPHLQLLFVPAGTGLVQYLSLLGSSALPVVAGVVGAWTVGLLATAFVTGGLLRRGRRA